MPLLSSYTQQRILPSLNFVGAACMTTVLLCVGRGADASGSAVAAAGRGAGAGGAAASGAAGCASLVICAWRSDACVGVGGVPSPSPCLCGLVQRGLLSLFVPLPLHMIAVRGDLSVPLPPHMIVVVIVVELLSLGRSPWMPLCTCMRDGQFGLLYQWCL